MVLQLLEQIAIGRKSHCHCDKRLVRRISWKRMSLLIIHVLQSMLELSEKTIGPGKVCDRFFRQLLLFSEVLQYGKRWSNAQIRIAPSTDELEYLRNKFDFPNTAGSELDVIV